MEMMMMEPCLCPACNPPNGSLHFQEPEEEEVVVVVVVEKEEEEEELRSSFALMHRL